VLQNHSSREGHRQVVIKLAALRERQEKNPDETYLG
jgi:hypothetical protein